MFQEGEILAPDGHCRPFDHRAAGTVFGSGVGVVVLRRLADAIADGDRIHAVIKGSAVNNDGATKAGYLAPSVNGQAEAVIEAMGLAGVDADTIDYVECHGTGTALGDPIEIEALTQAFRQNTTRKSFCGVGSVKSNIGHLDTAAGVVSLIKAALALKHGEIPPSLGYDAPNPAIDFGSSPFFVNAALRAWPRTGRPRRASVNSLGVGGTNVHVVLEQAPTVARIERGRDEQATLLLLSAKQPKALDDMAARLGAAIEAQRELEIGDVAHTLLTGRKHFEHRRVICVEGREDAIAALTTNRSFAHKSVEGAGEAVFLFPGGGAQHPGMARSLYEKNAEFRAHVDEGLGYLPVEAAADIRAVWLGRSRAPNEAAGLFLIPSRQLPAILITEVALARLWMGKGIRPTALIGHSMGENAAACIAGVLSFKDAVGLVHLRGRLFDTVEPGGMLSVSTDAATLRDLMPAELDIASVNAPQLCVVSGRNADLEAFSGVLAGQNIDTARVPIDIAAHSRMLDGILAPFETYLRSIVLRPPAIAIISNRDGQPLSAADATDPAYWVRHLRSTVEFAKGLAFLAADERRVFIEVGPGRTLSSLVKAQGNIDANRVINSLPHADDDQDDHLHFNAALGRSWAVGLAPDIEDLTSRPGARRVGLPTYPFQHKRYFIEPSRERGHQAATEAPLEKLVDMEQWGYRRSWKRSVPDYTPHAEAQTASWLIFLDDGGHGAKLATRLRGIGHTVATVAIGDVFAVRGADEFVLCPEDGAAGYDALVSALGERGDLPRRIVHLWLLSEAETFRPGSSFFQRNQECGFDSLLHFAQALAEVDQGHDLAITIGTNGLQRVDRKAVPYPEKATMLGPAMVIPREFADSFVRVVDFEVAGVPVKVRRWKRQAAPVDAISDQLGEEVFSGAASEIVAWRGERRWTQSYMKLPLKPAAADIAGLRQEGVYLFTGGLADLSITLARSLARDLGARLVLVGRTDLPPRDAWPLWRRVLPLRHGIRRAIEVIDDLEAGGGEVLYVQADVTDPEAMERAFGQARDRFGRIDGVFHAAGVVDDGLMAAKSTESIDNVLAPKLYGTAVLDQVLARDPVDLVVLFSSTSTDTAPAGQVDYVAANAYLNAYAEAHANDRNRRIVAIHWGVWNEVGMAARAVAGVSSNNYGATVSHERPSDLLFDRWVEDENGVSWLEADIGPDSHWMLDEHRLTSGQSILPGTAYIDIFLRAARAYGLAGTGVLSDLVFLRPLMVPDGETRTLRIDFTPTGLGFQATIHCAGKHAEALFVPGEPECRRGDPTTRLQAACTDIRMAPEGRALASVQEGHIRFGPRWRVLRHLALGPRVALAKIALVPDFLGDFQSGCVVHPALLDIATGCALELVPGYEPDETLWAPASYGSIVLHRSLPASFDSIVRLAESADLGEEYAAFDVQIVGDDGVVIAQIENFVVKRLVNDLGFADAPEVPTAAIGRTSQAHAPLAAQVRNGISPHEGFEALVRALGTGETQPIVSSMDLEALRVRASARKADAAGPSQQFDRPELDEDYVAPRNEIETKLAEFWRELLGVGRVGVHDNFFDVGGHSLIAVRLFRMIRNHYGIDLPMSVLFEAPTIGACAALLAEHGAGGDCEQIAAQASGTTAARSVHLGPLHASAANSSATPLFICAGMFGNVLNLRQLAMHVGRDRPVYALQARGLFGNAPPHETFEEMARDYLAEVRTVQPHGPYFLAGFSGGGITAYEMALQLDGAGEKVARLILLDTPLPVQPGLSKRDLASMKLQDVRRDGVMFFSRWLRNRVRWEMERKRRREARSQVVSSETFHNAQIEAAFLRALALYELKPYDGRVTLFRPEPEILYHLSGGRRLKEGRNFVFDDNGWTPFIENFEVTVVSGDHDSMVLEPHVRMLADRIRRALSGAMERERATEAEGKSERGLAASMHSGRGLMALVD